MGGWMLLCSASTLAGAEVTAAAYTSRGWTVRVVAEG
jgi:hypothetical protein